MIEIKNLNKTFGDYKALYNLNITVKPGEIFGFLGPNGAGKTTTVKIISGILMPTSGTVIIGGYDILADTINAKRTLAYIPDEPFVYPKLTGYEFLRFIGDIYKVPFSYQKSEIPALMKIFDLSKFSNELLEAYSHGMKQKLLIAGVLLRNPKVLLFDEPTIGLDPKSIKKFKDILSDLAKKGTTIFMCTHILEMAQNLCSKIAIINFGRLIAEGTMGYFKKIAAMDAGGDNSLENIFLKLTSKK
ncbi:MAG: ABC transporter ATP-binding protein [Elusimicrobia bacterium]|nr:ABC transporter ATP-binding protein [Elusimicrobiota bacterium]